MHKVYRDGTIVSLINRDRFYSVEVYDKMGRMTIATAMEEGLENAVGTMFDFITDKDLATRDYSAVVYGAPQ